MKINQETLLNNFKMDNYSRIQDTSILKNDVAVERFQSITCSFDCEVLLPKFEDSAYSHYVVKRMEHILFIDCRDGDGNKSKNVLNVIIGNFVLLDNMFYSLLGIRELNNHFDGVEDIVSEMDLFNVRI